MIDLVALRNDPERISKALLKKDPSYSIKQLIQLDNAVRKVRHDVEELRAEKNTLAKTAQSALTQEIRDRSRSLTELLKEKEHELTELTTQFEDIYLRCPNIPTDDVPSGGKESNKVISTWGTIPEFTFKPRNHVELGTALQWFNFEAAAAMSGSHFVLYQGMGARLLYALALFMFEHNRKKGYEPILPPYLINEQTLINASNFPRFRDQVYSIEQDKLYLTPTSEVNLTNIYQQTVLAAEELPISMTSWTSCFRREAGGYGANERGIIRIHQFDKVELYTICTPEQAANEQERMLACAEEILQKLGLAYRVMLLAAQDSSFAATKTYDIEVWMPGQQEYKEVSSISNCGDFQARRAGIRYRRTSQEKANYAATLNGSSLALPRLMVALMETYQQEDGSITIPDILRSVTITLT